jgi:CTP synthase
MFGARVCLLTWHAARISIEDRSLIGSQIACRCDVPLEKATPNKIAMFCQVEPEQVIAVHNVSSTYHVPLLLEKQGLIPTIRNILKLDLVLKAAVLVSRGQATWHEEKTLTTSQERFFESVSIALVGKYTNLQDSYLSVIKSLEPSAHLVWRFRASWYRRYD